MKCLACHGLLDGEDSQYHPKCVRNVWEAKRLPDLPAELSDGYYQHKHHRGIRSTLETSGPVQANIFLQKFDEDKHRKLLLQDHIACLLKFSKNLSGVFQLNEANYYVQSIGSAHSVESVILHHKEELPTSLEMMSTFISERSPQAGVYKSQLFDLIVLSSLMGTDYLEKLFGFAPTLDGQTQGWGLLELTVLQSVYGLPVKYLERFLKKLESKSKQIASGVKDSRLSMMEKSEFLMEWKESWKLLA